MTMFACTINRPGESLPLSPGLTTRHPVLADSIMADSKPILRTVEVKLCPTEKQIATLKSWMRACCWVYNRCLEQRQKAYTRRGESTSLYDQCKLITGWRERMPRFRAVPLLFLRDSARRVDRAFSSFFRRVKSGERKVGYPRFKSCRRWRTLESLEANRYVHGHFIIIPRLGKIRFRGGDQQIADAQKLLRIVHRASGWYAQLLFEDGTVPPRVEPASVVGIDVGLEHFATLSTGEHIANPRCLRKSEAKLAAAQRQLARKIKGSANRRKAVNRVARIHEKTAAQRKDFCHQLSRRLVNEFDVITHEALNINGLAGGMLAKSIHDAAWGIFLNQLAYKAEWAGRHTVAVDCRGTSQECPRCGRIQKKELSERHHRCVRCKFRCQRDVSSALVIRARGVRVMASSPVEGSASVLAFVPMQVGPLKQEVLF